MFVKLLRQPPSIKTDFTRFMTAHVMLNPDPQIVKDRSRFTYNFIEVRDELTRQLEALRKHVVYAQSHAILCIVHHRDYSIRDWRSFAATAFIQDFMLSRVKNVQFLFQVSIYGGREVFRSKRRAQGGHARPWFPFRATREVSMFLLKRDSNTTFRKWESTVDAENTIKVGNIWNDRIQFDYPSLYTYKSILDLFCHPDYTVYDCAPGDGSFAIASAVAGRSYIGIYTDMQQRRFIAQRISNIGNFKYAKSKSATLAASDCCIAKPQAGDLFSRGSGVG
jgi:hypothetical protein